MIYARVTGLEKIQKNLRRETDKIVGKTRAGLLEAGLVVRAEAQRLCPVDTGNLRASAYTDMYTTLLGSGVQIGFTAWYALFVHEVDAFHRVGMWKFLETAMDRKRQEVIDILKQTVRIRP